MIYYVAKNNLEDRIYGVEYGLLYEVIGVTEDCYVIKNNSNEVIEVNRTRFTEIHNLTPMKPKTPKPIIRGLGKRYV